MKYRPPKYIIFINWPAIFPVKNMPKPSGWASSSSAIHLQVHESVLGKAKISRVYCQPLMIIY